MSKNSKKQPLVKYVPLERRIAELRAKKPVDLNHGEALLLQGMAAASLREQRLTEDRIALED
ncbi:hypothetical protein HW561_05940 [Rhodobacteraceae bacterium B1Z28]|uniref:Uncharacterized protein n=1 Tax=Ruegeria haliotis TaxID=2747601 RepID=A0ABX2PMI6_9RHOB|nr:hypothetical protein [Ruegeria haliotis]NVO55328.1 hypothetical protein [Ruegeria haliotis]